MDIIQLYLDFNISYVTEGHKHARPGWVNIACPFCTGNPGYHLGFELENEHFYCWRCGWHPVVPTIAKLTNFSVRETPTLIRQYGMIVPKRKVEKEEIPKLKYRMPSNTEPLTERHKKYLKSRNFDPDQLVRLWHIVGTGVFSTLNGRSYTHRVVIPILWNNVAVSFTTRDITEKSKYKYISCPKQIEVIHHKDILYGRQDHWTSTGIGVEGPFDVWRLGPAAVATFGIEFTLLQVRVIAKNFKRFAVMYDADPQAVRQANKLIAELRFRGVDAFRVDIQNDPAALPQSEADYIVKQIL